MFYSVLFCFFTKRRSDLKFKIRWFGGNPRCQRGKWTLLTPSPRTNSELQLSFRRIDLNKQLKTSWTETLPLRTYGRSHVETGRKGGDEKKAGLASTCSYWGPEECLSCKGSPRGAWGFNRLLGSPASNTSPGRGAHIPSGCENQWGSCPPGRERILPETQVPSKGPAQKNRVPGHLP